MRAMRRAAGVRSALRGLWPGWSPRVPLPTRPALSGRGRGAVPSPLLDGDFLRKLDRLSLAVGRDLIGGLMGEHPANRRTSGIEFADYRRYSPGDDLRRVDWNAFARLGTLHVRQDVAEHDTTLYLLLDASPSMDYGEPAKFLTAARVAAALGDVALAHFDAVVLAAPGSADGGEPLRSWSFRGQAEAAGLLRRLQSLRPARVEPFDDLLSSWSAGHGQGHGQAHGQGRVAVVISDLLLDEYRQGVARLAASGFQVTVLHMLSADELHPQGGGDFELVDNETGRRLVVHLGVEAMAEYRRRLHGWLADVQDWCQGQGVSYLRIESHQDVERLLLDTLRRRGVTA